MKMVEKNYKKEIEETNYRKSILEALLVSSIKEENSRLPTIKQYILSEVINGTIDYVGGEAGKHYYRAEMIFLESYERMISKYFESEIKSTDKKLAPKIKKALEKMVECYVINPGWYDRPYTYTDLYNLYKGPFIGICEVSSHSTFSLPYDLVMKVNNKTMPSFSEEERKDIQGIGKAMRKYIDKDIETIEKTYLW